jgi:glutamine synthetase
MEMQPVEGYDFSNWDLGYGDLHLTPDMKTLRPVPWLDRTALILCDLVTTGGDLIPVGPRSILRMQIQRLQSLDLEAMAASELEYFLYRTSYRDAAKGDYRNLEAAGWYVEDYHTMHATRQEPVIGAIRRAMDASGVPVESSKGEWGPGQHELNLRYTDVLEMADRHAIYKQGFKEIAWSLGLAVSFMAKWRSDLAGSSMHLHLSLWDKDHNSAFAGGEASGTFRHFLGGWMHHARAIAPFYAPNPNSYKRYAYQSWAPTRIAWSKDNRTAGFRIVGSGDAQRIESRLPGADANPYLAYAAALAAGIDGIKNKTEPPAIFSGDAYQAESLPTVPANLSQATDELEQSSMLRQAFGEEVVEHYVHFFRTEQRKYDEAVTTWERERYFERG